MHDGHKDIEAKVEDLTAAYELGLLDDDQARRYEAATRDDAALLEELYDGAPAAAVALAEPGRMAEAVRNVQAAERPSATDRLREFFTGLLSPRVLAPAVVTAAVITALVMVPSGEKTFAGMAVLEPLAYGQVDVRGDASAADREFHEARDADIDERWDPAAAGLESALDTAGDESGPHSDQAHLYLGSARLMAGEPDIAVSALQSAASSPRPPVSERARWQLVQARLLLDDADGDVAELEGLLGSPVYGERARNLQERLMQP